MRRVGLIIPHTDTALERDLQRNLRGVDGVHTERIWLDTVTVEAEELMLRDEVPRAADYLGPIRPDVVVFGCTSAGALRGVEGENTFVEWLETTLECPVVSAFGSVRRHLFSGHGDANVWLVSPYVRAVHETMLRSLVSSGLAVRDGGSMGIENDTEVGNITPCEIKSFVVDRELAPAGGDCLFLSCTNLRAAECSESLSRRLGCHVTSSNLAILDALTRVLDQ